MSLGTSDDFKIFLRTASDVLQDFTKTAGMPANRESQLIVMLGLTTKAEELLEASKKVVNVNAEEKEALKKMRLALIKIKLARPKISEELAQIAGGQ